MAQGSGLLACESCKFQQQGWPYLLNRDHPSVKLSSVEMADTLCGLIRCWHGDKPIAPGPRTSGIGHHFGSNNLHEKGYSYFLIKITTLCIKNYQQSIDCQNYFYLFTFFWNCCSLQGFIKVLLINPDLSKYNCFWYKISSHNDSINKKS